MRDEGSAPPHRLLSAAAVLAFLLAATVVLVFDVLREIPLSYGCSESAPAGHDDVVAAYHSGALPLHLLTVGIALGTLTLLSAGRGRGPLGIGWPTFVALAAALAAAVVVLVPIDDAALLVLFPLVAVVLGITIAAGLLGASATGALAATLLVATAAWARRSIARGRTLPVRTALWALVVLTIAHLLLVFFQGDAPTFC